MKKLSVLGQILSRDEMKNIIGGGPGYGDDPCNGGCSCAGTCYSFYNVRADQVAPYCTSRCASYGKSWNGLCGIVCYPD